MQNAIGETSAATLGYITDGVRGARNALVAYRRLSQSNRNMVQTRRTRQTSAGGTRSRSVSRGRSSTRLPSLAARTASSRGRSRTRSKSRGRPSYKNQFKIIKAKVTPKFRKAVQKVINSSEPVGQYRKRWVASCFAPNSSLRSVTTDGYYGAGLTTGSDFKFLSEPRLKDAASILFNGKTKALDYGVGTGNFASDGFKLPLLGATCSINVTNQSASEIEVLLIKMVSKKDSPQAKTAYSRYVEALAVMEQTGGTGVGITYPIVEPSQVPGLSQYYNINTKRRTLKPGQSMGSVHYVKSVTLDWDKMSDNGSLSYFIKHVTCEYLLIYRPAVSVGTLTTLSASGRKALDIAANSLVVECSEYYRIGAPDVTDDARRKDNACWYYSDSIGDDHHFFLPHAISNTVVQT